MREMETQHIEACSKLQEDLEKLFGLKVDGVIATDFENEMAVGFTMYKIINGEERTTTFKMVIPERVILNKSW